MTKVEEPNPAGGTFVTTYSYGAPASMGDGSPNAVIGSVSYWPAGELLSMTGWNYSETRSYNSRLQLTGLNGVTFNYPAAPGNNGLLSLEVEAASGETITYLYDALNRPISASSNQGWNQAFTFDGFGNLTGKSGAAPVFSAAFDPATNRQVGVSYDLNGNQLTDMANANTLQYDVANRLKWAQKGWSSPGAGYGYDPDNRRVYLSQWTYTGGNWVVGGEQVVYYGVGGQKMGTYALAVVGGAVQLTATGYNVYFGGKLVRKIDSAGVKTAVQPDRLGSFGKYYPFGEQRGTPSSDNTEKFATYYRDGDTGLDYAENRYYSSVSGRFASPDPSASVTFVAPLSWNLYSYSMGDPVNWLDPSGLDPITLPGLRPVDQTQCISRWLPALQYLDLSVDEYFNSSIGLLGMTSFFEYQASFSASSVDQTKIAAWGGIHWTLINRFALSPAGKADLYGANSPKPVTFAETIFAASQVWTGLNKDAYGTPGSTATVSLKPGFYTQLYDILSGSPNDGRCNALAASMGTALRVLQTSTGVVIVPGAEPFPNPYPDAVAFTTGGVKPGHDANHVPVLLGTEGDVYFWKYRLISGRGGDGERGRGDGPRPGGGRGR